MKLRNKQTPNKFGKIVPYDAGKDGGIAIKTDQGIVWYYHSLAELNEEWEDYEEPKRDYYYIDYNGTIKCFQYLDFDWQEEMKQIGNYFETKEEAEKAVEKLKAWKRLKDKNFHFLKYSALGCGEIEFSLDFEDMDDEGEIGELRHDLDLLFGGEE